MEHDDERKTVVENYPGNPVDKVETTQADYERARSAEIDRVGWMGDRRVERLNLSNVEEAFRYQPWNAEQMSAGDEIRAALVQAARTILVRVPFESPMRTRALNALIDARMLANAAITFRGKF